MHLKGRFRILIHLYFTGLKMQYMQYSHGTETQPDQGGILTISIPVVQGFNVNTSPGHLNCTLPICKMQREHLLFR